MSKKKPLSPHAVQILRLIRQSCDRIVDLGRKEGKRPLGCWCPKADRLGEYLQDEWDPKGDFIRVEGLDSASAIRSLTARGFVSRYSEELGMEYWRTLTLAGRQELVRVMGPMPKQRKVKFSQLRKWSLSGSKRMPQKVVINGVVQDWVGIGHVETNDRPDDVALPVVVEG